MHQHVGSVEATGEAMCSDRFSVSNTTWALDTGRWVQIKVQTLESGHGHGISRCYLAVYCGFNGSSGREVGRPSRCPFTKLGITCVQPPLLMHGACSAWGSTDGIWSDLPSVLQEWWDHSTVRILCRRKFGSCLKHCLKHVAMVLYLSLTKFSRKGELQLSGAKIPEKGQEMLYLLERERERENDLEGGIRIQSWEGENDLEDRNTKLDLTKR